MMEKMKKSAENITMPDDVRERIIDKCSEIEKAERSGNNGYTDHVFTVERAKPNRIRRVVSGIAACAVLAGGIGATGVFLHRQGSGNIASEVAQEIYNDTDDMQAVRDEIQQAILQTIGNDNFNAKISYNTSEFLSENDRPAELRNDDTELTDNMLNNLASWINENMGQSVEAPEELTAYYSIDFHENDKNYSCLTFYKEGILSYNSENGFYVFEADGMDAFAALTASEDAVEENYETQVQSIIDDMTEKMCLAVNDGSYNAKLTTEYDIVSEDGKNTILGTKVQDMTNAMMFAMCGWIGDNSDIYDGARSGKILFEVSVDQGDSGIAAFTFFEEGFYTYAVTNEDGTESTYIFKGDCYEALDLLRSAMDTEKKHTEDNPAYYLPEFSIVKMGIDGNLSLNGEALSEEMCRKLQDIFYGYDYSAHEVTDVDTSTLEPVYSFKTRIGGNEQDYMRVLEVCNDGYICIITTDLDGNKVNAWHELVYKFDNDDILNAVHDVCGGNITEKALSDFDWVKGATAEYYIESTDKGGTLTEDQAYRLWDVLSSYSWDTEDIDREDVPNYGNIVLKFSNFTRTPEDILADMLVTDQGYIIVNALADAPVEVLATRVYKTDTDDIAAKIAEIFE